MTLNGDTVESTGNSPASLAVTSGSLTLGAGNTLEITASGQFLQAASFKGITQQAPLLLEQNGSPINATYLSLTSVSSSASTSVLGQSIALTATVATVDGGAPTGSVDFIDETTGKDLGSANVEAVGGSYQAILTNVVLPLGTHNILATYSGDGTYGFSSASMNQTVAYGTKLLFHNTKPVHSGAALPIKLALTNASGADISSSNIAVTAISLVGPNGNSVTLKAEGNSNPNNVFRYDASPGGYTFNLNTKGLAAGTYTFYYKAGNDPTEHSLTFVVD